MVVHQGSLWTGGQWFVHHHLDIIASQKQQRLCLLFVQTRSQKHKKSVGCVYTDEHGLKKLKFSCAQILWVADCIITLYGEMEEYPGPFTQSMTTMHHVSNQSIQFHYWNPDYLNLVEFW